MPEVGNWIGEVTVAQGIGNLSLDGALPGYASFSVLGGDSTEVWYAIVNGEDKEAGVGTLLGGLLQRTNVYATLVSGVYSDNEPDPINVQGDAEIYCTFNKTAFEEFANKVDPENAIFTGPAKFADGDVDNPSITFDSDSSVGRYLNSVGQMADAVNGEDVVIYLEDALRILQQLQASSGDSSAPGISFDDDNDTGRYLSAIGDMRDVVAGTDVVKYLQNTVQFLVQQQNQSGTAGEPSYSFSDDPISGLYLAAQGEVRMAAQGIDQMRWIDNKVELWDNTNSKWVGVLGDDFSGYTESFTLSDGQTEIVTSEDISGSAVFISGVDADNGRLLIDVDYTYDSGTKTITLADSRPAGTELYIQNVLEGDATVTIEKKFRVGRNLLINGNFRIWQRDNDFTPVATVYTADRWVGGSQRTYTRVDDVPPNTPFKHSMYIQKNSAANMFCKQEVELAGQGVAGEFYVGQVLTCSGYIKLPAGNVVEILAQFREQSSGGDVVADLPLTVISVGDGDWQYFEITWEVSASPSSLSRAYEINFSTANDTTAQEMYLTGLQLEINDEATPYDDIPVGELISLCQRYYQVLELQSYEVLSMARASSADQLVTSKLLLPVRMRTSPASDSASLATRAYRVANGSVLGARN